MGTLYLVQNVAVPTGNPNLGQLTSASLYTQLQVQATSGNPPIRVVEWGVSFNGSALAAGFPCDLVDTFAIAATVTSFGTNDVMVFNPDTPAQSGTSGPPLSCSTTASGFLSSAEGTITSIRVFDSQVVEPIGGYYKQFPLGREPLLTTNHNLRVRVRGDGTTRCVAYVIFEV